MSTPVGTCHSCGGPTLRSDTACSRCGADLAGVEQPAGIRALAESGVPSAAFDGLSDRVRGWAPPPPLEPGQRLPGSVAGRVAALLIAIVALLSVVDLVLTVALVHPGARFAQLSRLVGLADLVAVLALISFISAGAIFFAWLYRTTKAAPELAAGNADHGPAASVIWWFVPIANLFMPYLIMARLYGRFALPSHPARGLLPAVWWLSYLGSSITAWLAVGGLEMALTGAERADALNLYGVSTVLDAVAAVGAIWLIIEIERLKEERSRILAANPAVVRL